MARISKRDSMASRKVAPSLFTSANVQWAGQPVVFHNKHGENIELSQNNTVATRVKDHDCGVVCTCEPVSTGQMFKVTVLEKHKGYSYGLVSLQNRVYTIPYIYHPHTEPCNTCRLCMY